MAAPLAGLLTALRDPQVGVARHLFFTLAHSQGTVYAWDGIGEITMGGDVYTGIGSAAAIEGVSQSRELQTHTVTVTLQGVPFDALRTTDQDIRGDAAVIKVAWLDSDGTTYGPKTIFSGKGENLEIEMDGGSITLRCMLRGPMANWARPPASYYTPNDQAREFSADTGMSYIPGLENASANGWSINPETSGGRPEYRYETGYYGLVDDVTGQIIGHHANGLVVVSDHTNESSPYPCSHRREPGYDSSNFPTFEEDVTAAALTMEWGGILKVAGVECYVDASGDVRSAGGNYIVYGGAGASYRLRQIGAIASIGSATSELIKLTSGSNPYKYGYPYDTYELATVDGNAISGTDFTDLVFCDKYGAAGGPQQSATQDRFVYTNFAESPLREYVEEDTGNECTFTGTGGALECDGSDCTISTTGAVRTNAGKFVHLEDEPEAFLRVWT